MRSDEDNPRDQSKLNKLNNLNRPASNNEPSNQEKTTDNMSWRQAMTTVGVALSIPWMIGVPALIGWWVDKTYAAGPVWLLVGLVAGLLSTAVTIARLLRRFGQFK